MSRCHNEAIIADGQSDSAYGFQPTVYANGRQLRVLTICESRSRVTLRWQDGKETQDWAAELVPYHNIDE